MTIPIYNSEIAPPAKRGMIAGLHAQFVGIGFAVANWIGFGCSYSTSSFQWRFALAFRQSTYSFQLVIFSDILCRVRPCSGCPDRHILASLLP